MKNFARLIYLVFVLVFATSIFGRAQEAASITGVVTDPTGAVVPNVKVILANTTTGVSYKATSNNLGSYVITSVAPGPGYKITFTSDGFQSLTATGLYLNVSSTRTQNVTLKVGSKTQTVEVSASSQAVTLNTADATVGNNFQVTLVNELPVQMRDSPTSLFYLQPGVTSAGTVTGSRDDQTSKTLDGLDVNDMATGQFDAIAANAPVDSVQEFRGITAGSSSNTGQGGGGHFDMVTKGGTNTFHGNINEYHRDTAMTANSWFNNNAGIERTPLIRNQFGGNIGGPIKKNKAFFFFDYDGRRDVSPDSETRTIPTATYLQGMIGYHSNDGVGNGTLKYLSSEDVAKLDPSGKGFSSAILDLFNKRYPTKGTSQSLAGNGYNTTGYGFNASAPLNEDIYVGRLDYVLSPKMNLFARFTISRNDHTYAAVQFPGDPKTTPYIDRSHAWVIGHTWAINDAMTNNVTWGQTVTDFNTPNTYNPQGITQTTFGMNSSGIAYLDQPYASAVNAQSRVFPIPVLRDDFTWTKGRHTIQAGGVFKYLNPNFYSVLNYNEPNIGIGGHVSSLRAAERPADFTANTAYNPGYDAAFTTALGRYSSQTSVYNYDPKGTPLTQGSGMAHDYRYYEMEFYAQDTWKVTPNLTFSYGLRWVNYTVPYDKKGEEAAPSLDFDSYWNARQAQSTSSTSGDQALPFISFSLSGHKNGKPGMFNPTRHNFAPHVGFDYTPAFDRKTVISGSAGIDYDRSVITALLYQQSQYSFPVQISASENYGNPYSVKSSLTGDTRFSGISTPIAAPAAPEMATPYIPYVNGTVPYGLGLSTWSTAIDKNFKTPYNIMLTFGLQHEFQKGFLLKANYVGRFGRRLMAQADANQLIDFRDPKSGQQMSKAISNLEAQVRNPDYKDYTTATPVSWFENLVTNPDPATYSSPTAAVADYFGSYLYYGDFADTIAALASSNMLPSNVGMGSQFSEFTYYTNKGFSNYHGLLMTLHKNAGYGLQFDLNYTWSHSIDNVSVNANTPAAAQDTTTNAVTGFICDVNRPRECRASSDFDVKHVLNGDFIYELPVGRGRAFGATMPHWLDYAVGSWSLSGMPTWRTGYPYYATSSAFVAGYSNDAPAVLTGNIKDLKAHVHRDAKGNVWLYKDQAKAAAAFEGPTGFNIGSRNNLRGPHAFSFDLGVAKVLPLYRDKVNLKFRCDAYNVLNHPNFAIPVSANNDFTQSDVFGKVTQTNSARVLQGALRIEF
jgi:hypothetical protein